MKNIKPELNTEVHSTEISRAIVLTDQVWQMNANISIDEMCDQLDAISDIIDGNSTFGDFCETTGLVGLEKLN